MYHVIKNSLIPEYVKAVEKYTKRDDWYMWAHMKKGGITLPMFTSLDAYWPGIQVCQLYHVIHVFLAHWDECPKSCCHTPGVCMDMCMLNTLTLVKTSEPV